MSPTFEVFKRKRQREGHQPAVTILAGGNLSLNRAAHEAMGEPDAVELLYDRGERIIGLRPAPREIQHAFPVTRPGGRWVVSGRAFAQHFGLDVAVSTRRRAYVEGGVLCIDLRQPGETVSRGTAPSGWSDR